MAECETATDPGARRLWCAWGAALAALPCVPRSAAALAGQGIALVAPLQLSAEALAAVMLAGALAALLWRRPVPRMPARLVVPLAAATVATAALCELMWLPARLGSPALADFRPALDVIGTAAQAASLIGWAAFGLTRLADGPSAAEKDAPPSARLRGLSARALLACALCPGAALLAASLAGGWAVGALLCVAVAVGAWRCCARAAREARQAPELLTVLTSALAGLLLSALAREALSALAAAGPVPVAAGAAAYVAAVAVAAALVARDAGAGSGAPEAPAPPQEQPLEPSPARLEAALVSLPHGDALSPRERQVLARVAAGRTNARSAEELGLRPGTVSDYRRRGMAKLGLSDRRALLAALEAVAPDEEASAPPQPAPADDSHATRRGAACLAAVVLALALRPRGLAGWGASWAYACALGGLAVLAGVVLLARRGPGVTSAGLRGFVVGEKVEVPRRALALLVTLCVGLYASSWAEWGAVGVAAQCTAAVALAACALGLAGAPPGGRDRDWAGRLGAAALRGLATLALGSPWLPLVGGAALALSPWAAEAGQGVYRYALLVVALALSACALVVGLRNQAAAGAVAPSRDEGRLSAYLRGRGLNQTEAAAVALTARGATRAQISAELSVAAGTVNTARARGYQKLGVHSRQELCRLLAREAGLGLAEGSSGDEGTPHTA